jgi:hypothetical protein
VPIWFGRDQSAGHRTDQLCVRERAETLSLSMARSIQVSSSQPCVSWLRCRSTAFRARQLPTCRTIKSWKGGRAGEASGLAGERTRSHNLQAGAQGDGRRNSAWSCGWRHCP